MSVSLFHGMFRSSGKRSTGSTRTENFDLLIWKTAEGCHARFRDPDGGEAHADFVCPFRREDLIEILHAGGSCRDVKGPPREVRVLALEFGESLFRAVFQDEVLVSWRLRLREAERVGKGLRLRLHLDSPDLWDWPWELLYDPVRGFLASLPTTPVVRYIEMSEPIPPLQVRPPIRVLVVSACPDGFSALSIQEELADLEVSLARLLDAGRVELDRLEAATREALSQRLQEKTFHVLHFIGHGAFDASRGGGMVLLQHEDGSAGPIGSQELNVLLADHPQIRLVVLNVCQGARGDGSDPFAGLMQSLVKGRVPAVVAMRSAVSDRAAIDFSRAFYRSLSRREPVDLAVFKGRHAMFRQDSIEWGSPVLAMRSPDGRLFDLFWWEILADGVARLVRAGWRWIAALVLLLLLAFGIHFLGRRWIDPNLFWVFFNPSECPSPRGLSIAFVKVVPDPPLRPFCVSRFEITQRLWRTVVGKPPTRHRGDGLPVVRVSREDTARFFAGLRGRGPGGLFRLPTGPEWESAARAGEEAPPQASSGTANCANKDNDDGFEGPAPVGSYARNRAGLYDILGNASEWVSDDDGSGKEIRRGGGFNNALKNCSVDSVSRMEPGSRPEDAGFRIVRDLKK